MNVASLRRLASLLLYGSLVATLSAQTPGVATAKSTPPPPPAPPNPSAVYPQIVRISYLEGDVRVARGAEAEKQDGSTWEKAVAGLPIASGYSLSTGAGRAEIEFEDASTIYLADNSILTFDGLVTVGGVPHTALSLVTGTATLHVRPVSGETFGLKTATDSLTTAYPNKAYLRITSYTDAIAITSQKDETYQLNAPGSVEQKSAKGQTQFFNNGQTVTPPVQSDATDYAAWDSWVAGRVTQRSAAMKSVMKSAGLDVELPGLADLNGSGTFSACAPYGTCWDPPADAAGETAPATDAAGLPAVANASLGPIFPCYPGGVLFFNAADIKIAKDTYLVPVGDPLYAWVVCHAGTWIYQGNHYVWVVGTRKHHHPPIHWIKDKRNIAYVPLHPRDVAGKPPVNRKHDVYTVSDKKGDAIERTQFDANSKVQLLKEPPKEYRKAYLPKLERADDPTVAAHTIANRESDAALSFDHNSRTWVMRGNAAAGMKTPTGVKAFTGGNSNLRTGASNNVIARGGAGAHMGAGAGRSSTHVAGAKIGGAKTGGTHAGGAAHGGGGHAGGGGGSHGGGGGGGHGGGSRR